MNDDGVTNDRWLGNKRALCSTHFIGWLDPVATAPGIDSLFIELPENRIGADRRILAIRARLAFERQRLLEVKGDY